MLYYIYYYKLKKTVIKAKEKNSIKYNNSLKSIVVKRLSEQHVIKNSDRQKRNHLVSG